ncbi:TolC family protein [Plebeiibacterium marinum]|uniref:TolC family protein n=1 Tax=Plebeiibacterium marinum TaxID=2992111 RepID=A0AAE3MB35_9BACT|nr:TolC family protein [Plebeiobacterium marinum]MCW3804420.1 TolC family protein [Plebeiobacterium marinum]
MNIKIVLLLSVFFIIDHASAQDVWSLKECIQYALENNYAHKSYNLNERSSKLNAVQSKMDLLPSISASSSGGMSYGRSIDQTTNDITESEHFSTSGSVGANIVLFQGFSKLNKIAYTRYKLEAAGWSKLNHEDDMAFDVLSNYYNIIYYKGMLQIANDQLEISDINLRKTQAQVETGLKAKSDLLQIYAGLEKEKLDIILAKNRLDEEWFKLWQTMNYEFVNIDDFQIDMSLDMKFDQHLVMPDSPFEQYVEFSPFIKKSEADLNAAEKNVAIARGAYLPSVSVNANLGSRYSETDIYFQDGVAKTYDLNDQLDKNLNKYVGASVSIPIFNKNNQRTRVRQAKLDRDDARNTYEERKQMLFFELANNTRELNALYKTCIQAQKQVEADAQAFEVANQKYNEGLINIIEMLSVKEQLTESKSQLLLAKIQYEIKSKTIEFYKGNRFWK